ncbi:MAG: hypothetical protein HUU10_06385 [Bacteroidetes bacterium]|nr:hypothetical protein [Bacteroidota bacterium]
MRDLIVSAIFFLFSAILLVAYDSSEKKSSTDSSRSVAQSTKENRLSN